MTGVTVDTEAAACIPDLNMPKMPFLVATSPFCYTTARMDLLWRIFYRCGWGDSYLTAGAPAFDFWGHVLFLRWGLMLCPVFGQPDAVSVARTNYCVTLVYPSGASSASKDLMASTLVSSFPHGLLDLTFLPAARYVCNLVPQS